MKSRGEVVEFKQQFITMGRTVESFERDIGKLFHFNSSVVPERIQKLIADSDATRIKIDKQDHFITQQINTLFGGVTSLRDLLRNFQKSHEFLFKVQQVSQKQCTKMEGFKQKMAVQFSMLTTEQHKLQQELIQYEQRMEEDQPVIEVVVGDRKVVDKVQRRPKTAKPHEENQLKQREEECEEVERRLQGLGKYLGWNEEDHQQFVSVWQRAGKKTYFQMEEIIKPHFPFMTEEEVRNHMNKYMKWKELQDTKKGCIAAYKAAKEAQKERDLELLRRQEEQQRKVDINQDKRQQLRKQSLLLKAQLAQWKQAKKSEKQLQSEEEWREEEERRTAELHRKKVQQEKKKEQLQRWRKEKQQSEQAQSIVSKKSKIDAETQLRIRQREQQLIEKRVQFTQAQLRNKDLQQIREEEAKERAALRFAHVGSKVEQQTTAVREKHREKFDGKQPKQAYTFGGDLLRGASRATPSWLKDC